MIAWAGAERLKKGYVDHLDLSQSPAGALEKLGTFKAVALICRFIL